MMPTRRQTRERDRRDRIAKERRHRKELIAEEQRQRQLWLSANDKSPPFLGHCRGLSRRHQGN
jgi:hypothetical protein